MSKLKQKGDPNAIGREARIPELSLRSWIEDFRGEFCETMQWTASSATRLYAPRSSDGSIFRLVFADPKRRELR